MREVGGAKPKAVAVRIVAGEFRGRSLKSPTWEGLRPTSDRLRETLFNILGVSIRGARVLDGFAGTGAIGIEAISRGAAHVTFIERDPRAVKLIEANLALLGLGRGSPHEGTHAIIRAGFADAARQWPDGDFDLIVLDPPYTETAVADAIGAAQALVTPGTRLVIEHATRYAVPAEHAGLGLTRTVKAGDSALSFYARG
jgi:16S rRNA (guanine(966)-N(2))-methyltransferase RsmD